MGMMRQRLPPCVQDGDDADRGAEPTRIGGERRHRLGGGLEQDRVNDGLVLEGDRGDRRGKRKDDVEIGDRKQVCFPRGKPRGSGWRLTLLTVTITAGIIGDASHAAVAASLYLAAQRLGSARHDRAHYSSLGADEKGGMGTTTGVALTKQEIGNLQANSRHS